MTPAQHAAQLWLMGKNTAQIAHIKQISEPEAVRLVVEARRAAYLAGLELRVYARRNDILKLRCNQCGTEFDVKLPPGKCERVICEQKGCGKPHWAHQESDGVVYIGIDPDRLEEWHGQAEPMD